MDEHYDQARTTGVLIALPSDIRLARFTGPQAAWFLQNTVTADVDDLADGAWTPSCFLTPKGKLVAVLAVGRVGEAMWCEIAAADPSDFIDQLIAQRFRTKVEIAKLDRPAWIVVGPPASELAPAGEVRADDDTLVFGDVLGDVAVARVHGDRAPADLPRADADLYELLRIEAGVGAFGVDYGPTDLPQEAGLSSTLSVTKGCYVGQETVARIHFRGHVNRVVRRLRFDDATDPTAVVGRSLFMDGQAAGRVTSAARSPRDGVVGLGMVRVEPLAGAELTVEGGGSAVVGPLPEGTKVKAG